MPGWTTRLKTQAEIWTLIWVWQEDWSDWNSFYEGAMADIERQDGLLKWMPRLRNSGLMWELLPILKPEMTEVGLKGVKARIQTTKCQTDFYHFLLCSHSIFKLCICAHVLLIHNYHYSVSILGWWKSLLYIKCLINYLAKTILKKYYWLDLPIVGNGRPGWGGGVKRTAKSRYEGVKNLKVGWFN